MPTIQEKKEAEQWLKKHEHLLPQMSEGSRINGDPIITFDASNEYRLVSILRRKTRRENATFKEDLILLRLMREAEASPLKKKTWAKVFRAIGMTQKEIAKELGISQKTVSQLLSEYTQ